MAEINQSGNFNNDIEAKLKGLVETFKATQSW